MKLLVFTKFSHNIFAFSFLLHLFLGKNAKFRKNVCIRNRPKIFAFFRETFRSLETLLKTVRNFSCIIKYCIIKQLKSQTQIKKVSLLGTLHLFFTCKYFSSQVNLFWRRTQDLYAMLNVQMTQFEQLELNLLLIDFYR